ncbi:response regulator [Mameliella alba]|nr:response regulator [Mameliella alba]
MAEREIPGDGPLFSRIGPDGASHALMLEQAARIAQLGYFVFNVLDAIVEVCSVQHAETFGLTPSEFIEAVSGLGGEMDMVHPEDRDILREAYQRLLLGETIEMEYRFYRRDRSIGYIREVVAPERDASGRIVRGLGSSLDVTESRLAEERKAQANRLAALGELTAGVAHDVNNILAVVMGNAELLQDDLPDGLRSQLLSEIVSAAGRGGMLTRSLLNFAQKATILPTALDLAEEVDRAVALFERTTLQKARVEVIRPKGPAPIFADRDNLQSVILNILINARDAIREGGTIRIRTKLPDNCTDIPTPFAGDLICLCVQDDGTGIPAEHIDRVTEPFFTTKSRSRGSGLGLSMAAGFMRQLGGEIAISSTPGAGTNVRLLFPMHRSNPLLEQKTPKAGPTPFDRHHILLLEDEEQIRDILRRNLKGWGFTVTEAATSEEALRAVDKGGYDLALLDNYVPGSSTGVEIAARIKAVDASTPVILLTGLARGLGTAEDGTVDLVLSKPVPAAELRAGIANLLDAAPSGERAVGSAS